MIDKNAPVWLGGANVLRGVLMGGADVIPGVSGGTVALILGIYDRLVAALSRFDLTLLGHVRNGRWTAAARRIDLAFLATLLCGIALGIFGLGGLMNGLLTTAQTRPFALSAFFGMILASSLLVLRMIPVRSRGDVIVSALLWLGGVAFAYWLTGLQTGDVDSTYGYVFICGLVAICAMILPGISGAYLLLIMGLYIHLTDILKRLPRLNVTGEDLVTVIVFAGGCAIGLIAFSKALHRLLASHRRQTMSILCGFMFGAIHNIWPFQQDLTPAVAEFKHKQFRNIMPDTLDGHVIGCVAIALTALGLVLLLDRWTNGHEKRPLAEAQPQPAQGGSVGNRH